MQCLNKCLLPSMINYCLQLAFTLTLHFMRFTIAEQFVNIAKHSGQSIVPETCWESSKCSSRLRTRWRQCLNSCASRFHNSKFYYSLHLPLPDLPSWSLLLGLHRGQKGFFDLTTFLQSKQDDSEGSSLAIEKDANAHISIAINCLRKNVAFLQALQTTNYVLITSFCSQKQTNFAYQ